VHFTKIAAADIDADESNILENLIAALNGRPSESALSFVCLVLKGWKTLTVSKVGCSRNHHRPAETDE